MRLAMACPQHNGTASLKGFDQQASCRSQPAEVNQHPCQRLIFTENRFWSGCFCISIIAEGREPSGFCKTGRLATGPDGLLRDRTACAVPLTLTCSVPLTATPTNAASQTYRPRTNALLRDRTACAVPLTLAFSVPLTATPTNGPGRLAPCR